MPTGLLVVPEVSRWPSTKFTLGQRREIKKIAKAKPIEQLYAIADRQAVPQAGDPEVVFCDEFGPLNLPPRPGRQWAAVSGKNKEPGRAPLIGNADHPQDLYLAQGTERAGEPEVDETAELRWVPVNETPAMTARATS